MVTASACGKIILFGEHAVVYGQPAIAMPVHAVQAHATVATVEDAKDTAEPILHLPDLNETLTPSQENALSHALLYAIKLVEQHLGTPLPPVKMTVSSTIPIASGLGSGAATAAALIRAILQHQGHPAPNEVVNRLTYQVETLHHGTPSGIDNTVICYEQPVCFVRNLDGVDGGNNKLKLLPAIRDLNLLIVDTGVRSETKAAVGDVRRQWEMDRPRFDALFAQCGAIADSAMTALAHNDMPRLGELMTRNHTVLQKMTVSSPELDVLVGVALAAGALGAKLSGGGRGGNMIALVDDNTSQTVTDQLKQAGAPHIIMPFDQK